MADDPNSYLDLEGFKENDALAPRYIHAGDEFIGQSRILVEEDAIALIADRKNLVAVDPDYGVILAGDISLSTMPDHISFGGGYFRLNPLVLSTVPSSSPTPLPMLVRATPNILQGLDNQGDILSSLQTSLGI